MKVWILILVVLAFASSVVNARITAPGTARPATAHSIGLD
jgi:hypothetical protein